MMKNLNIRVADEDIKRADALISALSRDSLARSIAGTVSRSDVLRLAMNLGLAQLERDGSALRLSPVEVK